MDIYETLNNNYLDFGNKRIRVIIDNDDEAWFHFVDTATALGIKKPDQVLKDPVLALHTKPRSLINSKRVVGHPYTKYLSEPGLYKILGWSKKELAVKFTNWLHSKVAPALRKYGKYQFKGELESEIEGLLKKVTDLTEENEIFKNDLKKEKFPDGALLYVIEYPTKTKPAYRVGITGSLKTRDRVYRTHLLHKKKVVFAAVHECPIKLEMCVRAMLYDCRYRDKKDFYLCPLNFIISTVKHCIKTIRTCDAQRDTIQKGGALTQPRLLHPSTIIMRKSKNRIRYLHNRIEQLNHELYTD